MNYLVMVSKLIEEIKSYAVENQRFEVFAYIKQIEEYELTGRSLSDYNSTEEYLLSPGFLKNRCFNLTDVQEVKKIIRNYKLNSLNI